VPEIDNIGNAIVKGVLNPEAEDLAVDLGDFELGSLIDENVLKDVPFIKIIIACPYDGFIWKPSKDWSGQHSKRDRNGSHLGCFLKC
jgi:hypothetical protein